MSKIWPTYPYVITWGLITKHEQLFKYAGLLRGDLFEKKNYSYLTAEAGESDPWAAFCTPSLPNFALIELGLSFLAWAGLVGPRSLLHLATQSSATSSRPTTRSELINSTRLL